MKTKIFILIFLITLLISCDTLMQGLVGYGGYGGYQVYPGGYARNTSYDYLLDPNYAMMQYQAQKQQADAVNQQLINMSIQQAKAQEQQEYEAAKRANPYLTKEQWTAMKAQSYSMQQQEEHQSSGSSSRNSTSSSSSSSSTSSNYGYKDCTHCLGSGKCKTCNGTGLQDKGFGVGKIACGVCIDHNGKCRWCQGKGKVYGVK